MIVQSCLVAVVSMCAAQFQPIEDMENVMKLASRRMLAMAAAVVLLLACGDRAQAAELKVLSGTVTRSAITKIGALFEQQTAHKLALDFATTRY